MRAAKVTRSPARIVTVSPADWNRHRQRVVAKHNEPLATTAGEETGWEARMVRALVNLMSSQAKAKITEKRLVRRLEEHFREKDRAFGGGISQGCVFHCRGLLFAASILMRGAPSS